MSTCINVAGKQLVFHTISNHQNKFSKSSYCKPHNIVSLYANILRYMPHFVVNKREDFKVYSDLFWKHIGQCPRKLFYISTHTLLKKIVRHVRPENTQLFYTDSLLYFFGLRLCCYTSI